MILDFDMGNTRLKWRLSNQFGVVDRGHQLNEESWDRVTQHLGGRPITQVRVASVVGEKINRAFSGWINTTFGRRPLFAKSSAECCGVRNGYKAPETLGVDRWLAIVAAYTAVNDACLVVDCGSAVTVDLVGSQGAHIGGYIAPGLEKMRSTLCTGTQSVKVLQAPAMCDLRPGTETTQAVHSALSAMIVGLVANAFQQMQSIEPTADHPPAILFTGGDALWLAGAFPEAVIEPELVFQGLALVEPLFVYDF